MTVAVMLDPAQVDQQGAIREETHFGPSAAEHIQVIHGSRHLRLVAAGFDHVDAGAPNG